MSNKTDSKLVRPTMRRPKTRAGRSGGNTSMESTASASSSAGASASASASAGVPRSRRRRSGGAAGSGRSGSGSGRGGAAGSARANIKVAVRCRPFSEDELKGSTASVLKFPSESSLLLRQSRSKGNKQYTFDRVFDPSTTQEQVYESVVAPIVEETLAGYSCTIFAYGQTGTGKTFTMEGRRDPETESFVGAEQAGIIPRTISSIFEKLEASGTEYSVRVSYLEIYNEELHDLLGLSEPPLPLRIFEDSAKNAAPGGSVTVHNLEEVPVSSASDIFPILERGQAKRAVAATKMNASSSRSHAIFSITIHVKESNAEGEDLLKVGKLHLVDLAGSENVGKSGAVSKRAREAGLINQSLLTLGRVINALIERRPHIPYRESKLTRILQDSLGGTTKTCVIATVSPSELNFDETLSTLDYASRAKTIINTPVANERMTKRVVLTQYIREIEALKSQLQAAREASGVYLPLDQYTALNEKIETLEGELETAQADVEAGKVTLTEVQGSLDKATSRVGMLEGELARTLSDLQDTRVSLANTEDELAVTRSDLACETEWAGVLADHGVALTSKGVDTRNTLLSTLGDLGATHAKIDAYASNVQANMETASEWKGAVAAEHDGHVQAFDGLTAHIHDAFTELRSKLDSVATSAATSFATLSTGLVAVTDTATKSAESTQASLAALTEELAGNLGAVDAAATDASDTTGAALADLDAKVSESLASTTAALQQQAAAAAAVAAMHMALVSSVRDSLTGFESKMTGELAQLRATATAAFAKAGDSTAAHTEAVATTRSELIQTIEAETAATIGAITEVLQRQAAGLTEAVQEKSEQLMTSAGAIAEDLAQGAAEVDAGLDTVEATVADVLVGSVLGNELGDEAEAHATATIEASTTAGEATGEALAAVAAELADGMAVANNAVSDGRTCVSGAVASTKAALATGIAELEAGVDAGSSSVVEAVETVAARAEDLAAQVESGVADVVTAVDSASSAVDETVESAAAHGDSLASAISQYEWAMLSPTGKTPAKASMERFVVASPFAAMPVRTTQPRLVADAEPADNKPVVEDDSDVVEDVDVDDEGAELGVDDIEDSDVVESVASNDGDDAGVGPENDGVAAKTDTNVESVEGDDGKVARAPLEDADLNAPTRRSSRRRVRA